MFFKDVIHYLGPVPSGIIEELMLHRKEFKFSADSRRLLGHGSHVQSFRNATPEIKTPINNLKAYIESQNYRCIENSQCVELSICTTQNGFHILDMPSRYMSFLGEQLIIPINSAVTVINKEDNRQFTKPIILEIGHCYRINNRISLRFIGDPDFMALVCVYLNNNAKKSIQDEKELHKYYPRQVHEYL